MKQKLALRGKYFVFGALFLLVVSSLFGCGSGDTGATGDTGPAGPQGPADPPGADKTTGTVDAGTFTFEDLKNIALGGKIISASTAGDKPTVTFQVINKATGEGIRGLGTFALHIAQLKPAADGSASYWLNYILNSSGNPSADPVTTFKSDGTVNVQGYSVKDNGDSTYVATFGTNIKTVASVPYDATLIHRIVVGVRSVAVPGLVGLTPGAYAGPMNPLTGGIIAQFTNTNGVNLVYDFTPSTGAMLVDSTGKQAFARDIVTRDACNQCHYKIEYGFPRGNNTSGHFGSRPEIRLCVMCHTPQLVSGEGRFTSFIHKIHMGEELPVVEHPVGVNVNEFKYAQDVRNCVWCHKGTTPNWNTTPTLVACGSCHNNVNFATGAGHAGGAKGDDKLCALCHTAVDIANYHVPVDKPNPNNIYVGGTEANTNAAYVAAVGAVPAGANRITYVVSSVSRNASKQPVITFKFQKDGVDVVFNAWPNSELIDGFAGSPSVYFAWSVPQDGIATPADYNASASSYIKNLWRGDGKDMKGANLAAGAAGTMTGPAGGYYTITLTGVTIPDSASMLTGGVGYTYSLTATPPLTQTNVAKYPYTPNPSTVNSGVGGTGGLIVPAPDVWKVATGYTGRRLIVSNDKCNTCHGFLGVKPTYHAGQRNDAPTCTFCHTVNRTNSGWPVNINYDVHAIHGAALRNNKFSWEVSAGAKFWEVGYPGLLKNCEMCHLAGMYDFSNSAYTANSGALVRNLLMTTAVSSSTGTPPVASATPATIKTIVTGSETVPGTYYSPFVAPSTTYGNVFIYYAAVTKTNPAGGPDIPAGTTIDADPRTLVLSPISAACSGCHDSATARLHMRSNGGSVFDPRSVALGSVEQCLVCHGPANNAAFNETVPTIKAVHRWW